MVSLNYSPMLPDQFLIPVIWRFDREPPQKRDWLNLSRQTLVMRDANDIEALLGSMRAGNRVAVRVHTSLTAETTHFFDLSGATHALARLPCLR